jgi:6-phosphogluconolactonase
MAATAHFGQVKILEDPARLAEYGAGLVADSIQERSSAGKPFRLVLSGGSTPAGLYRRLASPPLASKSPWDMVHLFWGDERCLPPDHPDSNYHLAARTLLAGITLPSGNIHRIPGELGPEAGAAAYEDELRRYFGPKADRPDFDLVLLGLGPDGHMASLFPGHPLDDPEGHWVMGVPQAPLPPQVARITMTLTAINAARRVVFLVAGTEKAGVFNALRHPYPTGAPYPAGLIRPRGEVIWLLDRSVTG